MLLCNQPTRFCVLINGNHNIGKNIYPQDTIFGVKNVCSK